MTKKITIGTFECTDQDIEYVAKALKSNMISVGPELHEFERQVSSYHSKKYGCMVNSGQSAIEVAIEAYKNTVNLPRRLFVLMPSTTYAATLWAIIKSDCIPIFCDIDENYVIDYHEADTMLSNQKIDILLPVDLCGYSAEPPQWFKKKYPSLFIIQDACEAFGNQDAVYGDIVCHSFYVSHIITTGAGGMLSYNSDAVDEFVRSFIAHGRSIGGDFTKFTNEWVDRFLFNKIGASYRSDNIAAALGLSQMARLDSIIAQRKRNAKTLVEMYEESSVLKPYFTFPDLAYVKKSVFQFFPVMIEESIERSEFLKYLFEKGIDSRVLLSLTNQPAVIDKYGEIEHLYPKSQEVNNFGFIIGCHQGLSIDDMRYIIEVFTEYIER